MLICIPYLAVVSFSKNSYTNEVLGAKERLLEMRRQQASQSDRQTKIQTYTQTDRQTERQMDRKTETKTRGYNRGR